MIIHPADRIRKAFREFVALNNDSPSRARGSHEHHVTSSKAEKAAPTTHEVSGHEQDDVMLETTLVRDGMYCGRRFALEGFNLVYFAEEQQVKLYSPSGNIERRCTLVDFYRDYLREEHDARRAA